MCRHQCHPSPFDDPKILDDCVSRIFRLARSKGCRFIEQELAQEALKTAFNKIGQLQDPAKFVPWVVSIARRKLPRLLAKEIPRALPAKACERFCIVQEHDEFRAFDDADDFESVARAIHQLSDAEQTVLFHWSHSIPLDHIAARMGLERGAVIRLKDQALKTLRLILEIERQPIPTSRDHLA